jgi:type I restriction enzyme S subunit
MQIMKEKRLCHSEIAKSKSKPEIRFAGFADAWEQRKLGDVTSRIVRKNQDLESTLPLTISSLYGLVDQITYFNNRVASRDISNYYLIKRGEFAYNKSYSDGFPWGSVKRLDHYKMGVLSTLYIVFALNTDIVDSDYLVSYYETDNWHKEVAVRAAEGARNHGLLNISSEDFFDTALQYPKEITEQAKIGEFFKMLDHLITLHQRELKKLQNIKKSLLEKMFV